MEWAVNVTRMERAGDGHEEASGVVSRHGGELLWEAARSDEEPWRITIARGQSAGEEDLDTLVIGDETVEFQRAVSDELARRRGR